jgi:Bacterial Ig-like domain
VAVDKGSAGDTFRVVGKSEAGDTVTLGDGTTVIGTATVAAGGTWSITTASPLAGGAHSLTAHEVDAAANTSPASAAQNLTVESASPNAVVFAASAGPVLLTGGAGNDAFYAGGDTTMTGGTGANQFAFSARAQTRSPISPRPRPTRSCLTRRALPSARATLR